MLSFITLGFRNALAAVLLPVVYGLILPTNAEAQTIDLELTQGPSSNNYSGLVIGSGNGILYRYALTSGVAQTVTIGQFTLQGTAQGTFRTFTDTLVTPMQFVVRDFVSSTPRATLTPTIDRGFTFNETSSSFMGSRSYSMNAQFTPSSAVYSLGSLGTLTVNYQSASVSGNGGNNPFISASGNSTATLTYNAVVAAPEPASLALFGVGFVGCILADNSMRRIARRKAKSEPE